jgi:hypothetical protein
MACQKVGAFGGSTVLILLVSNAAPYPLFTKNPVQRFIAAGPGVLLSILFAYGNA